MLFLHGIESHSLWFQKTAEELGKRGRVSYAYDRFGWGQSEGTRGHSQSFSELREQVCSEISRAQTAAGQPIHLVAQSWGGLLAVALIKSKAVPIQRLTLIAPGIFPSRLRAVSIGAKTVINQVLRTAAPMDLPYSIDDLATNKEAVSFIANDLCRITSITTQTAQVTLELLLAARRVSLGKGSPFPEDSVCILADRDNVVNSARTSKLMKTLNIQTKLIETSAHSLSLDFPKITAQLICRE